MQRRKIAGTLFEVPEHYHNLRLIGIGSSGAVCSALDFNKGKHLAVKKISNFLSGTEMAQRCYRELKLLKALKVHPNLAQYQEAYVMGDDLYLVTEFVPSNLHELMRDYAEVLPTCVITKISFQLLSALTFLHDLGIAHRDLKPENILINPNTLELQLCDLGLARSMKNDLEDLTGYVTTRSYRAPEVMLSWRGYGLAMDMWSVGCILAEMLTGRVLFPARDHIQHLAMMMGLLGEPPAKCLPFSVSPLMLMQNKENALGKNLQTFFKRDGDVIVTLIERMLKFDPAERITAKDALLHLDADANIATPKLSLKELELDLTLPQWREKFCEEVQQPFIV